MKLIKTRGIVLKEITYGDNDKILTVLTEDYGLISMMAKGAKKSSSPLLASSQYLVYSEFVLFKGTSFYHVNSASSIATFYKLKNDIDKLMHVFDVTKNIISLTDENMDTAIVLKLFLNMLYAVENMDKDAEFLINIFKIKMLICLGYSSDFRICAKCKENLYEKKEDVYYDYTNNGFFCKNCLTDNTKRYVKLTYATYNIIRFISAADTKKVFLFDTNETSVSEIKKFGQAFLGYVLNEL